MAYIPAINCVEVCFHFTQNGQNYQVCLSLKKTSGSVSDADLAAIAGAATDWWDVLGKANFADDIALVKSSATDLTTQAGHQAIDVPASPIVGTGGATPTYNQIAAVTSRRTAGRGRSRRGRMYWPGLHSGWLGAGSLFDLTAVTNLLADLATMQTDLEGATSPPYDEVVISRQENNVVQNPANAWPVTAYTMDQTPDTQRRRTIGKGA